MIPYGASIIAIDPKNNKIVGATLAGPNEADEVEKMIAESKKYESSSKKWSEMLLLLAHLEGNANIYERYNVDRALKIHVLGVNTAYRGKSIGRNLMKKCCDVGKSLGYPLVTVDCSSVFSIKIAENLGMECINQMAYSDFKDKNGKQLFKPPAPHTYIKTFIQIL